jgi:urease accessory protein
MALMAAHSGEEATAPEAGAPLAGHALWQLLQISDQLFPTGAYAFSHALETYVELGLVHDRASCQQLLVNVCENALGPCDMVFCTHAFQLADKQDLQTLVNLDRLLQAYKVPQELRLESQHTGQAFLRASLALGPPPLVQTFLQEVQQGTAPGNHAIAFGLVAQSLGLSEAHAVQGYLYNITAGWVAAALRLVPLGQAEGQRLLHDLAPTLLTVQQRYGHLTPAEAWSCTPGLDIRSMQHERLYTRLFRS